MRVSATPGGRPNSVNLNFLLAANNPYWRFEDIEFVISPGTNSPTDTTNIHSFEAATYSEEKPPPDPPVDKYNDNDGIARIHATTAHVARIGNLLVGDGNNRVWVRVKAETPAAFIDNPASTPWVNIFELTSTHIAPPSNANIDHVDIIGDVGGAVEYEVQIRLPSSGAGHDTFNKSKLTNSAGEKILNVGRSDGDGNLTSPENYTKDRETWFTNLPRGLEAKVKGIEDTILTVTISGTPIEARIPNVPINVTIPQEYLVNSVKDVIANRNDNARFNIGMPRATVNTVNIIGSTVLSMEEMHDILTPTQQTGQRITVTLHNDTFNAAVGSSRTGWFKNLPAGLTATATITSPTTARIVIAGTPTAISNAPLQIEIPRGLLNNYNNYLTLTGNTATDVVLTVTGNARFDIREPSARVIQGSTVTMQHGSSITAPQTFVIELDRDTLDTLDSTFVVNAEVGNWIGNFPGDDFRARISNISNNLQNNNQRITISIYEGTASTLGAADMEIVIPVDALAGSGKIDGIEVRGKPITVTNTIVRFNVTQPQPVTQPPPAANP
jgi:hypothetical protein